MTSFPFLFSAPGEVRISPSVTSSLYLLGISIPIADFPGIGVRILTSGDASANAISSARLKTLPTFTPVASWISYLVT